MAFFLEFPFFLNDFLSFFWREHFSISSSFKQVKSTFVRNFKMDFKLLHSTCLKLANIIKMFDHEMSLKEAKGKKILKYSSFRS
jgi:hypothetical protein